MYLFKRKSLAHIVTYVLLCDCKEKIPLHATRNTVTYVSLCDKKYHYIRFALRQEIHTFCFVTAPLHALIQKKFVSSFKKCRYIRFVFRQEIHT